MPRSLLYLDLELLACLHLGCWQGEVMSFLQILFHAAAKARHDIAESHSQRGMPTLLRVCGVLVG